MPKILIVEDQVLIAHFLRDTLLKEGFSTIEIAFKINQAIELVTNFEPEIILLDINVEGKDSGIIWAENYAINKKIIFVTGQTERETMQKALKVQPVGYLTKPIKKIELIAAIELAKNNLKKEYIKVKDGYEEIKLYYKDILFAKSERNYVDIQTISRKITLRNTLDNIQKELDSDIFCRVHRSYIVNKEKISSKTANSVTIGQYEIPISRNLDLSI
jgi:two-component system, LytTR family, response regulator LytT